MLISIRNARVDDMDQVYEIEKKCFKDPYPKLLLITLYQLYPELFLVAEDTESGRIVGYVSGIIRRDGYGHIVSLCVDVDYRRRGIGGMLMKIVEDSMKRLFGVCRFRLEVRVSNEPAIRLYISLGYRISSVLKKYYIDGEDAYLMIKDECIQNQTSK
jgi:ribosomal-protein-alanine N-acetyltransferase